MSGSPVRLPAPDLPRASRAALLVATTDYVDPTLRQLRAPAGDAASLSEVLSDPMIGGFDVTQAINRTAQEVRLAIEEFLNHRSCEDVLLLYFSCHGISDARRRLYFAATDTRTDRLASTGIDSVWVNEQLEECRARTQVVVLDCCFSGAFGRSAKGPTQMDLTALTSPGRGRAVLTASSATEYSFEEDPKAPHHSAGAPVVSVFTAAFTAGLRDGHADGNGDGIITVGEAYDYAYRKVKEQGSGQTPQHSLTGGEGDIWLARSPSGRSVTPAPLPDALRTAVASPFPDVRTGAVAALREWLDSGEEARSLAAQRELSRIARDDIPRVATAALEALDAAGDVTSGMPDQHGRGRRHVGATPAPSPPGGENADAGHRTPQAASGEERSGRLALPRKHTRRSLTIGAATAAAAVVTGVVLWSLGDDERHRPVGPTSDAREMPAPDFTGCLVSDSGGLSDIALNQSSLKGLQSAEQDLGIETHAVESAASEDYAANLDSMVAQGCDVIIGVGFTLEDAVQKAAEANPWIDFALVDSEVLTPDFTPVHADNVRPLLFNVQEAAFLAGYLAAGYTSTGTVATCGGAPSPAVTIFMDGFVDGVAHHNVQNGSTVKVLGWDKATQEGCLLDTFSDTDVARAAGDQLIAAGADVIFPVAGPAGTGMLEAAAASGASAVWAESDGYLQLAGTDLAGVVMTSVMKNVAPAVLDTLSSAAGEEFTSDPYVGTLRNGGVSLAPFRDYESKIPRELLDSLAELRDRVASGDIVVDSAAAFPTS